MLWNLISWITVTKKMSPSHWIKLSCLPASFFMWYLLEMLSLIFHLSWCTIRKQAFAIKMWPNVYKNLPRLLPWKYQVVLEILRWCWKVKNVVPRHSKMGRGEHCSRYVFSKLTKTITLVRKRWFFSKVLTIQDGQEYLSIKIVCDTNIKLYFTPYSTALWP